MCKCCDGSEVVQVRIWTFQVSVSAKCVVQRGVGLPGSDATSVMLRVILYLAVPSCVRWGGHLLSRVALVLPLVALGLAIFHCGILAMEVCSPPGAGVGPSPGGNEPGKKAEAGELLQALSLLHEDYLTPEDFVKYQVLLTLKPKPGKTREQELADRVKSLQRLRSQEATHKGSD